MANCASIRVDHLNLNVSSAEVDAPNGVYNPTAGLAYFVYANQADVFAGAALLRNHALYFRTYDPATQAFGTPVEIVRSANDATGRHEYPRLVRLTDGRLIVAYNYYDGAGWGVYAKESADNGATWSAAVAATAINAAGPSGAGDSPCLATDGTNVWVWSWRPGGGGSGTLMRFNKRTGVGTWGTESTIYDGDAANTLANTEPSGGNNSVVFSSTIGMFFMLHYNTTANPDEVKLSCFRSTDGANFTEVVVKDYGTDLTQNITNGPKVVVGTDGRIRAMWLAVSSGGTVYSPVIAYSDDQGATWNYVGTPSALPVSGTSIDQEGWGFSIGPNNRLYFSCFVSGNSEYRIYRGGDDTAGWELAHSCTYVGNGLAAGKRTSSFFAGGFYLHAFETAVSGPHFELNLLSEEFTTPGGGPGPETPLPSLTGADENNVYIRKVLGPKSGGWSVHTKPVSCWMAWDEGDRETGREVPIIVAGSEVWPKIQDAALVGIINRIEAPDLYAVRAYEFNGTRYDPLKVAIWSKEFLLNNAHERNAARAIFLTYTYAGTNPFRVELWADGHMFKEYRFNPTLESDTKYRACPTFENTCEKIQLRIDEESADGPLLIDTMGFVYIKKGRRGNA